MGTPIQAFGGMRSEIMDNFIASAYIEKWGLTDKSQDDF
jgi:hypothetical protein